MRDIKRRQGRRAALLEPEGADDVATRGALRGLDRRGGKVVVRVVPIAASPSTSRSQRCEDRAVADDLVIGRKGAARVIVGLTEPREIAQAVGDALAGR